ncbi:MAG TPA: short-chain dehydrogenase, partial [Mucilaginibacter sp.]
HAYTQALRLTLEDTPVKVFELMPPLVDTEFSVAIGGANGIPASQVANDLFAGLQQDELEIHVGRTKEFYNAFFAPSANAILAMNGRG